MKIIKTGNFYKKAQFNDPQIPEEIPQQEIPEEIPQQEQSINPLDGKSNQQAKSIANKIIPKTPGFYSDNSWEGIQKIWQAFNEAGLNWSMTDSKYDQDKRSVPTRKTWQVEIYFTNNKGKETILYGTVVAAGAGTIDDPLSRYDITAYVM